MWKSFSFVVLLLAAAGNSQAIQAQPLPPEVPSLEALAPFASFAPFAPTVTAASPAPAVARAEFPASFGETSPKLPEGREGGLDAPSGPVITSATGASFFIESRAPQAGIRKVSTRTPAMPPPSSDLERLTSDQLALLEKLNRVDAPRLKRLSTIVVPAMWADELAYSPFPQEYPWAATKAQTIVVDQEAQAFGAYEYGRLVRWGPVSTGEGGKTPAGLFQLSWRSRGHTSSVDPTWYLEWYFNFMPSRGIAFHQYSLPGRAGSHGCVRMLERDAQWLFEWGQARRKGAEGTTVIVLGCPDVSKPWQSADFLRGGITLPEVPPNALMECTGNWGVAASSLRKTVR